MQSALRIAVSLVVLSSALAGYHSKTKLRRDGVLNLYPFPRVGRASRYTWQVPLNDFYLEYEPAEEKRQLYAFPRVGRSDSRDAMPAPSRRTEQGGMWFGPRVGRSDRTLREPMRQPTAVRRTDQPGMWFGPRLGRSNENDDDGYESMEKRPLHAFPRVGRGDDALRKQQPGMWFGPRVGRGDQALRDLEPEPARISDEADILTIQNDTIDRSEPEIIETIHEERKKRQV